MLVWVTWYSQWQNHNRMAKLPCLVSSVILSVYIPERYYKCVTCLHGTTFLAFKNTMCCHGITYRLYIDIMPLPSLLCHSRIPPSVEYRYIGQTNAEVRQYPDLSDPAPAGEPCQHYVLPCFTELTLRLYRHIIDILCN